jgi:hypothetical protein
VLAHIIPEEDFAKTGPPSDADLGGLLNKLHALGPAVDWTAVITAHADAVTFFATAGETVMGEIKTAMLMRAQAAGSGTHHKEIELREMLDYAEVQLANVHRRVPKHGVVRRRSGRMVQTVALGHGLLLHTPLEPSGSRKVQHRRA